MKGKDKKIIGKLTLDKDELAWLFNYPCVPEPPDEMSQWYAENLIVPLIAWYDVLEKNGLDRGPVSLGVSLN